MRGWLALRSGRDPGDRGPFPPLQVAEIKALACALPAEQVALSRWSRAEIAREAVEVGARVLWLQLGVTSDEAGQIARDGGLEFVQDRCVKIEHARFFGGLNLVGMNTGVISSRRSLV